MWHLEKPSKMDLDKYCELLMPLIKGRINRLRKENKYVVLCDFLLPDDLQDDKIKAILVNEPADLIELHKQYIKDMALIKSPKGKRYSENQLKNFLLKVFDYGCVNRKVAYIIADIKRVNTCPYCNRSYTFTIGQKKNGKIESKVRPQFDHWFAHMQFPLLGLSFYNLIPSCSTCNSSAKGSETFNLDNYIHPYTTTDYNPNFIFRPVLAYNDEDDSVKWSVLLKREAKTKEDNTIRAFFLDELYAEHGPLEVKDIMDFAIKNNPTYLHSLFGHVCADLYENYSMADVYRMLFGIEAEMDKMLNRPLTKLKRDILEGEGIIV